MLKRVSKRLSLLICSVALLLSACSVPLPFLQSSDSEEEDNSTIDLTGEWTQANSHNNGNYQAIFVAKDYIEVYWLLGSSAGAALYWAGSFKAPENLAADGTYEFKSEADTSRTKLSLLACKDPYKTFKYADGQFTYKVGYKEISNIDADSNMVMTVSAEKDSWGYDDLRYRGTIDMFDVVNTIYQDRIGSAIYTEYHVGDVWEVEGEWSFSITNAQANNTRNQYVTREPAAVYALDYTYTNIGWTGDDGNGLQFAFDDYDDTEFFIVDVIGRAGYSYPITTQNFPRQIPVGETCAAQGFIAVDDAGTFRLTITKTDSNGIKQGAVFVINI